MKPLHLPPYAAMIEEQEGRTVVYDSYRRCWVSLTPEEWVRQHFLHYLTEYLGYPMLSIRVENAVEESLRADRSDALIYGTGGRLIGLIECKAPEVKLSQATLDQLMRYNLYYKAPLLIMTNGLQHCAFWIDYRSGHVAPLTAIPTYQQAQERLAAEQSNQ